MKERKQTTYAIVLFLLMIGLAVLAGCIQTATTNSDPTVVEAGDSIGILYQQAEAYYRNGFKQKALERYMEVIEKGPNTKFAAPSMYKIGGIYMKNKSYRKAVLFFDRIIAEHPRSSYAVEAQYQKGYCYLQMGDPERGINALESYLTKADARNPERARMFLAEAEAAVGRYDKALIHYAAASAGKTSKKRQVEILSAIRKLIDGPAPEKSIVEAERRAAESHATDFIRYRLALIEISKGRKAEAKQLLQKIDFGRAKYSFYKDVKKVLGDLEGAQAVIALPNEDIYTIGVVLPLTGPYSVFGEPALHGIMLGVDFFGTNAAGNPAIEVVVKDSKGDPEVAAQAVAELAADPKVTAIIGPLMSKTAKAAAEQAEQAQIPIITLASSESIADTGTWVFRNSMTLSMQVKTLINYANNQKGCRRFAILHPDTKLGEKYAALFSRYLDPIRNDITANVIYTSEDADFRNQVRKIKAGGDFDAIFLPDKADRVALIAPQLVYFGIKGKLLLGTPSWNDPILAKKAKGYLEDTAIVDSFFVASEKPNVKAFSTRYELDFSEPPTHIAAHGYDTVAILADLFKRGMGESRGALKSAILGVRQFPGVTGNTTFLENGDVTKDLTLLRVGDQGIEELF